MKTEDVVKSLESDLTIGLKSVEVESRLKQHGYNEVLEKKKNPLRQETRQEIFEACTNLGIGLKEIME